MSGMVERAALAVADEMARQRANGLRLPPMCPINVTDIALAVMQSIRIPTQAMLDTITHPHCVETMDDIKDVWVGMIDEALKP